MTRPYRGYRVVTFRCPAHPDQTRTGVPSAARRCRYLLYANPIPQTCDELMVPDPATAADVDAGSTVADYQRAHEAA